MAVLMGILAAPAAVAGAEAGKGAGQRSMKATRRIRLMVRATLVVVGWLSAAGATLLAAERPVLIPYPKQMALYLSTDIGCDQRADFCRLGVVFSIERLQSGGSWQTIFSSDVPRRAATWQHWDIPLGSVAAEGPLKLRFVTDSYSRAQDRGHPVEAESGAVGGSRRPGGAARASAKGPQQAC